MKQYQNAYRLNLYGEKFLQCVTNVGHTFLLSPYYDMIPNTETVTWIHFDGIPTDEDRKILIEKFPNLKYVTVYHSLCSPEDICNIPDFCKDLKDLGVNELYLYMMNKYHINHEAMSLGITAEDYGTYGVCV